MEDIGRYKTVCLTRLFVWFAVIWLLPIHTTRLISKQNVKKTGFCSNLKCQSKEFKTWKFDKEIAGKKGRYFIWLGFRWWVPFFYGRRDLKASVSFFLSIQFLSLAKISTQESFYFRSLFCWVHIEFISVRKP